MELGSKNLSNNEVASGNFSQNTLVAFNADFNGLEKTIGLFFPSIRNAIVERYRAETTLRIGIKAQEIVEQLKLETKPIPPKAALPLFDKLSLEHEEEMYDVWAKLLVAASDEYNPVHIYYAELLSKIGFKEARILIDLYNEHKADKQEDDIFYMVDGLDIEQEIKNITRIYDKEYGGSFTKIDKNSLIMRQIGHFKELVGSFDTKPYRQELNYLKQLGLVLKVQTDLYCLSQFGYFFVKTLEKYKNKVGEST